MTEYTLRDGELGEAGAVAGGRRPWLAWALRLVGAGLLVGWSAKWLPALFAMVGAQTAIGQHGLSRVPSGYEVFELLFVAGHLGVRWLPGVAVALALFWVSGRIGRRPEPR